MEKEQIIYNRAIDNLTYLVLNYPKPVQELLGYHNVFFKGKPSKEQLINEIVELIGQENTKFITALEQLMIRFSAQENDQFWGAIAKGALGIVGGLLKGRKRRRSSSNNAGAAATAAAQAAAAKRDMQMRMAQMRAAQQRQRREEQRRRREEQERRVREEKQRKEKEAAAKKKTNMMLIIGGGVIVLGVVLAIALRPKAPTPSYLQFQPPMAQPPPIPR